MIPQQIENQMIRSIIRYHLPAAEPRIECECGCKAHLKINGELRCWECAEDEGVQRV